MKTAEEWCREVPGITPRFDIDWLIRAIQRDAELSMKVRAAETVAKVCDEIGGCGDRPCIYRHAIATLESEVKEV